MSFSNEITIKGLNKTFALHENCKRYTLRDNGFEETKNGSFQLVRSLDAIGAEKKNILMKLVVSKDMKQLRLSITTGNGLTAVDLYKMKNNETMIEKFEFLLEGLVDRDVLIEK